MFLLQFKGIWSFYVRYAHFSVQLVVDYLMLLTYHLLVNGGVKFLQGNVPKNAGVLCKVFVIFQVLVELLLSLQIVQVPDALLTIPPILDWTLVAHVGD